MAELNAEDDDDVAAPLLRHVHQIGHVPTPGEVVFLAEGAMPYAAHWEWLVIALREVLGVKLPASARKAVEKILAAPRPRRNLPPLPVVVHTGGRFIVRAVDLAASCPPPRLSADEIEPLGDVEVVESAGIPKWIYELSDGNDSLNDALTEAWVARLNAHTDMLRCGGYPRACSDELEAAEGILEAISTGRVPRSQLAEKAAQVVEKFDAVWVGLRRVAGHKLTVEFDRETDGRWIAKVPELSGVMVYGGSQDEALAKVVALARSVLADQVEHGELGAKIRNSSRSSRSRSRDR
jgi:predicted RNase H-like HicB family nuclease